MVQSGEIGVEEAARMVQLIQKDPESSTVAAFLGWKYTPSGAERAAWDIKELDFNAKRARGKVPIKLPRPWQGTPKEASPELVPVDSPERLAAIERLKANS